MLATSQLKRKQMQKQMQMVTLLRRSCPQMLPLLLNKQQQLTRSAKLMPRQKSQLLIEVRWLVYECLG